MSQQLRYIVDKLNFSPYNRHYNMVVFDSLGPLPLLQVLNDVLAEIAPEHKIDLREEPPEQTAFRMFSLLRILKYKPETEEGGGLNAFRHGLLQGNKGTIYPLLGWLFEHSEELKKRSYLAKFLVKIDVPAEFLQEEAMVELNRTYLELVEQFKDLHKTVEQQRSSQFNVTDVRKDITAMEEEKEQLAKRIERLKKKASSMPMQAEMLEVAKRFRRERDRELELNEQKVEQKNQLLQTQQRASRLEQQLADTKSSSVGLTQHGLVAQLEEENHLKKILAQQTLPQKIEEKRQECIELERVVTEPLMSDADLDSVRQQIEEANEELTQLMEKYMPGNDPVQDKLALFRQQAAIIARKKQMEAENYKAALDELSSAENELREREEQLKRMEQGGTLVKEEEFKRYIAKLRSTHNTHQKKKKELSQVTAEFGVLARTEEILKSRDENVSELITLLEEKKGVRGYVQTQETLEHVSVAKSGLDKEKEERLEAMSQTIDQLTAAITAKKTSLAPLIKELRPFRQQHQELQATHAEKKVLYDQVYAGFESNRSHLELEVKSYWEEKISQESQYHYLQAMQKSIEIQQQKVAAEMKSYTGKEGEKRKSLRDQYTRKIQEQENLGRALRDKQNEVRSSHAHNLLQVKMWQDLQSLLQAKRESHRAALQQQEEEKAVKQAMMENPDRLVIT